jgi:hypothetical protein
MAKTAIISAGQASGISRGDDPPGEYSNFALAGEQFSQVERKIRAFDSPMSALGADGPSVAATDDREYQ